MTKKKEEKIKVFIVDDSNLSIDLLIPRFQESGKMIFVGRANSGEECLRKLKNKPVDIVIMDIGLPGIDGIETVKRLKTAQPEDLPRIIFLTNYGDKAYADKAYELEASIIGKHAGKDYLISTIERIHQGEQVINMNPKGIRRERGNEKLKIVLQRLLTPHELKIACLIRTGKTAREIADKLNSTSHQINNQKARINHKLQPIYPVINAASLSAIIQSSGLCPPLELNDLDDFMPKVKPVDR